jgi:hypothetical protein
MKNYFLLLLYFIGYIVFISSAAIVYAWHIINKDNFNIGYFTLISVSLFLATLCLLKFVKIAKKENIK